MAPEVLEDRPRLDIRQLARAGWLGPGERNQATYVVDGHVYAVATICAGEDCLDVFGANSTGDRIGATVTFTEVPLTFGSRRYFVCPECAGRCSILVFNELVCQGCTGLPHLTATLSRQDRLRDKVERARQALGMDANGHCEKPPGMWADTWLRLRIDYWEAREALTRHLMESSPL